MTRAEAKRALEKALTDYRAVLAQEAEAMALSASRRYPGDVIELQSGMGTWFMHRSRKDPTGYPYECAMPKSWQEALDAYGWNAIPTGECTYAEGGKLKLGDGLS